MTSGVNYHMLFNWNGNVQLKRKCRHFDEIFITALEVIKMTSFGAASDENFVKMTIFIFSIAPIYTMLLRLQTSEHVRVQLSHQFKEWHMTNSVISFFKPLVLIRITSKLCDVPAYRWTKYVPHFFREKQCSTQMKWINLCSVCDTVYLNSLALRDVVMIFKSVIPEHMLRVHILFLRNCSQVNARKCLVNIGPGNGLVPPGNKPLPEPMLTKINVAIWSHQASMSVRVCCAPFWLRFCLLYLWLYCPLLGDSCNTFTHTFGVNVTSTATISVLL